MKIKIIGFSVTGFGKPSFPVVLQTKFDENRIDNQVSYTSLGGLSIDSLPFLMDTIMGNDAYDVAVLELTTSWFSKFHSDIKYAHGFLEYIVNYLCSKNIEVVFLNLYRRDIDDNDVVVRVIDEFYAKLSHVIDLKSQTRIKYTSTGDDGTTDGVHPKPEAIMYIADELYNFFITYNKALCLPFPIAELGTLNILVQPEIIKENEYIFSSRHGLTLSSRKLISNKYYCFLPPNDVHVTGIFFIYGPDTGLVTLEIEDDIVEIKMYDEMSFYRRLGYTKLPCPISNKNLILSVHKLDDVKLQHEPREKVNGVNAYIAGFSCLK